MLLQSASSAQQRSPELHRRLRVLIVFVVLALGVLVGRLWQLQVLRGDEYFRTARDNLVRRRDVPPVRGKIVDRAGRPLADNRPAFNLYGFPARIGAAERARLIELLALDPDETERLDQRIAEGVEQKPRDPILLLEDQGRDRATLIAQSRLDLGGVEVRDEPFRRYPHGVVAGHLVGYLNHLNSKEYAACKAAGCTSSDFVGRYGLERQWDELLRGTPGEERYVTNARGDRIDDAIAATLIDGERFRAPTTGHDLVLSIDLDLQLAAERAAQAHAAAAIVVVEVASGRLLALVSTPSFDPNAMTARLSAAEYARMTADPRLPFIDKTVQHTFPPGSVYKIVTGGAALDDRATTPGETTSCAGSYGRGRTKINCTASHGKLDFGGALQHSCNVYFLSMAERIGLDRMSAAAQDLGFGERTGLGLNGDRAGRAPTRAWYEKQGSFRPGYTLNAAIGQGDVEVTVLQVAMAYAALANGGRLMTPQLVERVRSAGGATVRAFPPVVRRQLALSAASQAAIREALWRVVNQAGGTGHGAKSALLEFSGKTGTAQSGSRIVKDDGRATGWNPKRDHAWFAGYAPSRAPEIAIAVLIEHGGPGGKVAAPVARDVIEAWARGTGRFHEAAPLGPPAPGAEPTAAPAPGAGMAVGGRSSRRVDRAGGAAR